jgi:hypothetical protein
LVALDRPAPQFRWRLGIPEDPPQGRAFTIKCSDGIEYLPQSQKENRLTLGRESAGASPSTA